MQLNVAQAAFSQLSGGTFVGMDTLTKVALPGGKKNPFQGRVMKRMSGAQVMCFTNQNGSAYEAMVKRRLVQEGKDADDFQLSPRAWGHRIDGTPFVEHKGNFYLEVIFLKAGEVEYLVDGQPVDKSEIEGLDDTKSDNEGQGGLANKVIIRSFSLDSITALRANGQEWR